MKPIRVAYPLLLLCFYISSCSPNLAPVGHYQDTPVTADGKADDWHLPLRFIDEKHTYQFNVTNDEKNIYIIVTSSDNATQRRILKTGMTLYFDHKGKEKKDMSLSFPTQKDDDDDAYNRYRERNGYAVPREDQDSLKEKLVSESNVFNTNGFLHLENGQFGIGDSARSGIRLALRLSSNDSLLVYEAIVPLNLLLSAGLTPKQAKRNFSVDIELNAVPGQVAQGGGRGGGGGGGFRPSFGMGMGGMGMGMGGMRGGGGGGRNGNSQRSQGAKEEYTWYTFRFVTSSNTR